MDDGSSAYERGIVLAAVLQPNIFYVLIAAENAGPWVHMQRNKLAGFSSRS